MSQSLNSPLQKLIVQRRAFIEYLSLHLEPDPNNGVSLDDMFSYYQEHYDPTINKRSCYKWLKEWLEENPSSNAYIKRTRYGYALYNVKLIEG